MKNIYFVAVAVLLLSACNNNAKRTEKITCSTMSHIETKSPITQADYDTMLMAAFEDQIEILKNKIQAGANINHADTDGRTALMLAAFNGHIDVVDYLLDNGADCKKVDNTNRSALMFACTGPFLETVKHLISAGAEVNGMDSHEKWTPLMFAASEGQLEIIKFLLESGADVTMIDVDGESSYDFAISRGHDATAEYLKNVASLDLR